MSTIFSPRGVCPDLGPLLRGEEHARRRTDCFIPWWHILTCIKETDRVPQRAHVEGVVPPAHGPGVAVAPAPLRVVAVYGRHKSLGSQRDKIVFVQLGLRPVQCGERQHTKNGNT
jgi:hypothetical protein